MRAAWIPLFPAVVGRLLSKPKIRKRVLLRHLRALDAYDTDQLLEERRLKYRYVAQIPGRFPTVDSLDSGCFVPEPEPDSS